MANNDKAIPLASLNIQELSTIKQRTEEDIANFTESINALSEVIERFMLSRESLEVLKPENKGKEVIIPITSSLYVPATLEDCDTVMVDIGAKYYARKTVKGAENYCTRRIEDIKKNLTQLQEITEGKKRLRDGVNLVLQQKLAAIQQRK